MLTFMLKYTKNLLPLSFTNMFQTYEHQYETRSSFNFDLPYPRMENVKYCIIYKGPFHLNKFENVSNIDDIKIEIKAHLLQEVSRNMNLCFIRPCIVVY